MTMDLFRYILNLTKNKFTWQIGASIFVFILGWFVSKIVGQWITSFLNRIHLNKPFERMGWKEVFDRVDIHISITRFIGEISRWSLVFIFLMFSVRIVNLSYLSQFLWEIIKYFPNIFIAIAIFVGAVFLADLSQKIVVGTLEKEKITYSRSLARAIRWIIWFLAVLAILYQLKIVPKLILTIFIGIVFAISISLGISFGFGARNIAAKILKELEDKFK